MRIGNEHFMRSADFTPGPAKSHCPRCQTGQVAFGACSLGFLWCLVFGVWNFGRHPLRNFKSVWLTLVLLTLPHVSLAASRPLSLHPDNPHYFLFRSKLVVLITSGEHYGAVLNLDF